MLCVKEETNQKQKEKLAAARPAWAAPDAEFEKTIGADNKKSQKVTVEGWRKKCETHGTWLALDGKCVRCEKVKFNIFAFFSFIPLDLKL